MSKLRSPRRLMLAGCAVMAFAVAACGGQPLSSQPESAAPPAAGGSRSGTAASLEHLTAPEDDRAKAVIDAIAADPKLNAMLDARTRAEGIKMSTGAGYPPSGLYGRDGKTIVGMDPSLGRAIANKLGVKYSVVDADFNTMIPGVLTGRYNMIMAAMTDNKKRQQQITFIDYVNVGIGMLVAKGNPLGITGPAKVCGRTIAVVDNGSSLDLANKYSAACEKAGKPAAKMLKFNGDEDALIALTTGRAQINITDYVVCAWKAADPKLKVEAVALPGTESPWGIGLNPANKQMIDAVQAALDSMISGGEYGRILQAWGMEKLAVKKAVINGGTE